MGALSMLAPLGIAAQGKRLLVVEETGEAQLQLEIVGVLRGPSVKEVQHWVGLSLHAGRLLALDVDGYVFEFDFASRAWAGPWGLGAGLWHGICADLSTGSWL